MTLNSEIGGKYQNVPQSLFLKINMNFSYHHTKPTNFSRETVSLSKKQQYCDINSLSIFQNYITSHDEKFPLLSPLWLMSIPTHNFFITCMQHYFDWDVGSQSMRAGGATSLAENSIPPPLSFNSSAAGLPMHFSSTSEKTQCLSKLCCAPNVILNFFFLL